MSTSGKDITTRGLLVYLAMTLAVSLFLLLLIVPPVVRHRLYGEPFFYLGLVVVLLWWGLSLFCGAFIARAKPPSTATRVATVLIILGTFGSMYLGYLLENRLKYDGGLFLIAYWLVPVLLGFSVLAISLVWRLRHASHF
jgi:hypothetical protein